MIDDIKLGKLNVSEGARYLGYGANAPDEKVMEIIRECEAEIIATAKPRYIYRVFNITEVSGGIQVEGTSLTLLGNSIKEHLKGCDNAVFMCATLSADMDKLIKITEVRDMAKAVIMDAFAGTAIEQVCDRAEGIIKNSFEDKYFTYRFGIGYGDLPIEHMPEFLNILNAAKAIGVTAGSSNMMSPLKSVACIIGISDSEIKSKKRGCITCNMREKCKFRIRGERCGF